MKYESEGGIYVVHMYYLQKVYVLHNRVCAQFDYLSGTYKTIANGQNLKFQNVAGKAQIVRIQTIYHELNERLQ